MQCGLQFDFRKNKTDWLTNSMEPSPSWEANRYSASQEIPHFSWNLKIHYCIHKSLPPVPTLRQINPIQTPSPSHVLKIRCNIILPSTSSSYKWSLLPMFPNQNHVNTSSSPTRASYPVHLILLVLITQIMFGEEHSYTSCSLYCFFHTPVTICNKNVWISMNLFICSDKKYYSEVWYSTGSTVNFPHQNNNISSISLKVTIMILGQQHESKLIYVYWVHCTWALL